MPATRPARTRRGRKRSRCGSRRIVPPGLLLSVGVDDTRSNLTWPASTPILIPGSEDSRPINATSEESSLPRHPLAALGSALLLLVVACGPTPVPPIIPPVISEAGEPAPSKTLIIALQRELER